MVVFIASIIFFIELIIKNYLRLNFSSQSFPVIKNIFYISVVFNRGAAFGILKNRTTFLIYIGIFFLFLILFLLWKEKKEKIIIKVSYGLILGGALSNLFDRIFLGYVVDYLDFRIWPVFNLADTCISIGIGLLFLDYIKKYYAENINRSRKRKKRKVR
ncbi:MAG TPA: signal peptidase II [Candidatus Omnitrophica bacterium]|nr:signal peptidase II [Candidatus Omnitrophota bacterium]